MARAVNILRAVWAGLRQWSGDDAYERFLAAHKHGCEAKTMTRAEFYRKYFDERANRPRCC